MIKEKLKIALGDLRHETAGRNNFSIPLAIGYIGAYTLSRFGSDSIDLRLYTEPNDFMNCIKEWKPNIIGLSSFSWNTELSLLMCRVAKKETSGVFCVLGGPEFPAEIEECETYLTQRSEIDVYVYGDSELAFANLISTFIEKKLDLDKLKSSPIEGTAFIHPKTQEILMGERIPRSKDMDMIPSPYLTGLLDPWFTENNVPSVQFTRGCPFTCAFCYGGRTEEKHIGKFSIQRIKEELNYIAEQIKERGGNKMLQICDTNWGMYKRDEEIASYLAWLMDKYDWPMAFDVNSGKEHHDRIMSIAKTLKGRFVVTVSPQSLNPETLKAVKRKRVPVNRYFELVDELESIGQKPPCELIIPLPEETKISHLAALKTLIDNGIYTGCTYTTIMLKGTSIASKRTRDKYQMNTKYRLVPRQFGEYGGEKCYEIEEVCIETNTMPFSDYLDCRGFAFIVTVLTDMQFDIIRRHLKELGISFFDFIYRLWETATSENNYLSEIFSEFMNEAEGELFDSRNEIYEYFSEPAHYNELLNGKRGDNLLRKYRAKTMIEGGTLLIELVYSALKKMAAKNNPTRQISDSLEAAKQWAMATRNISKIFQDDRTFFDGTDTLILPYDVVGWYRENSGEPLISYNKTVGYNLFYDKNMWEIIDEGTRLHGSDKVYMLGKLLVNWKVSLFWRSCLYKM